MIGRIKGVLIDKQANQILLDVNGLAYEIEVPMSTLFQLPELGSETVLYTSSGKRRCTIALLFFRKS